MKFYFCEACGKRLTEHDIEGGAARNKKLKGVFCKACGVGVTTMESLPLTDSEAKKVLEDASDQDRSSDRPQRPKRSGSGAKLLPRTKRGDTRTSTRRGLLPASQKSNAQLKVVVPAVVVVIAAVGLLIALSGGGNQPGRKAKRAHKVRDKTVASKVTEDTADTDRPLTGQGTKPSGDGPTDVNGSGKTSIEKHSPSPIPSRNTDTAATQDSPQPQSKNVTNTENDTSVVRPEPPNAEPVVAKEGPTDLEVAWSKLEPQIDAFDQAISKGDASAARRITGQLKSDPSLKPVAREVEALDRVGQLISEAATAKQQAREGLMDGKKRSFQTIKNTLTGKVRKIENDTLCLMVEGQINKQTIEYEKRVKISDLTPACRAKLLGEKQPATPDEWMAETVLRIAAKDTKGAEETIAKADTHPLKPHYQHRLYVLRFGKQEAAAVQSWKNQIKPLLAIKEFSKPEARRGLETLKEYRAAHGKTDYAKSQTEQAKALEMKLLGTIGPPPELALDLGGGVKMEFVLIQPGTFMMGAPKDAMFLHNQSCKPQRKVTISKAYYLGKYEVTQAEHQQITGTNRRIRGPRYPAANMSWGQMLAFCEQMSAKTGRKVRLPTEAEWEYACRAGTQTAYFFGDQIEKLAEYGWLKSNAGGGTHEVGQKKPNPWGLYDMYGNVLEFCQDWLGPYPENAETDPTGASTGRERVHRGCSFLDSPEWCRSCRRGSTSPGKRWSNHGMRVLLEP